jgi:hypothetical protein
MRNKCIVLLSILLFLSYSLLGCGGGGGGSSSPPSSSIVGLSSINDTPQQGALSTNAALIDGNLKASSGIDIGQSLSLSGDFRQRQVGLDSVNIVSLNKLYVYVDRQLPPTVVDTFRWDIYFSADNQKWILSLSGWQGGFNLTENRFEIVFPAVTSRYVKAVTRPLSVAVAPPSGFDISNIYITEVQAF